MVIETDDKQEGVRLEYEFLEYRTYEEAIIFRPKGQQLAGFRFEPGMQYLIMGDDGKHYDNVSIEVTAFTEEDYCRLKDDWTAHHAYEDDEDGRQRHLQLAEDKKITYEVTGWFDISRIY